MLYSQTPIGLISVPSWIEKELSMLSDKELLERAVSENNHFCISPAVYAMIEKRNLETTLQKAIKPNIGVGAWLRC